MRYLAAASLAILLVAVPAIPEEQTIRMRVSATIPPAACDHDDPDTCEASDLRVAGQLTRVAVDSNRIYYVGSRPAVERGPNQLTVLF